MWFKKKKHRRKCKEKKYKMPPIHYPEITSQRVICVFIVICIVATL